MSLEPSANVSASISVPSTSFVAVSRAKLGDDVIRRPSVTYWTDAWHRLRKNRLALISGAYIVILSLAALIVPEISFYSYDETEIWNKHAYPNTGVEALVIAEQQQADSAGIDSGNTQAGLETESVHAESGSAAAVDPLLAGSGSASGDGAAAQPSEAPANPTHLRIDGTALTTGVKFVWDKVPGAEGYRIYRSQTKGTLGLPLSEVSGTQTEYMDNASLQPITYFYVVTAYNSFGESNASATPEFLEVHPKLALELEDALKLDPHAQVGQTIMTKPHYLGTDYLGRDLLVRLMSGARISLFIGFVAPFLYILIGIIYGSVSGYFGGVTDDIMMRIADIVYTIPYLLFVITLQVVMGSGLFTLIVAMVVSTWAASARQIRGQVLQIRETEFVQAAKILGTSTSKIIGRHVLPNTMGIVLVLFTLSIPQAIFTEAFLSFIGLGIAPPLASWGTVTREGAKVFLTYPHELIIPAAIMSITMLAFNLVGDGLRDALDPKMRGTQ